MSEFNLQVSQEEWDKAGSKFIEFNPADPVGTLYYHPIEIDVPDWDTPGVSIKFPVRVTEGPDFDREDKISCGVGKSAIWKLKEVHKAITGKEPVMKKGADGKNHPFINGDEIAGKKAVGVWELQVRAKGGDPTKGEVKYPKLVNIMPAGYKPSEVKKLV